ncbi:MAG: aminoacyl-tRNA hydrolase [Novosphingobium sp.]
MSIIAFVGSVFSPYYAWAHGRGNGDPDDHCSLNVCLYGPGARRWTMTERGRSVAEALRFYKLEPDALTVFHDELDLAPFKVKVRTGGGLAGHNGLRSINQYLGPDFRRVRIGIGHPGHKDRVTGHVLGNYAKSEADDLAAMLGAIAAEAEWLAKGEDTRFMSDLALRLAD